MQLPFLPRLSCSFTLPAVVADAELLPGQVAVSAARAATVVPAVRDVAGLSLPVLLALTVHTTRDRVRRAAPAVARTVVGTGVYPEGGTVRQDVKEVLQGYTQPQAHRVLDCDRPDITLALKYCGGQLMATTML